MDNIDKILKKMEVLFREALSHTLGSNSTGEESDVEIDMRWNAAFPYLDVFKVPPHMRRSKRYGMEEEPEPGMPPD